jgi:hypothetical protein
MKKRIKKTFEIETSSQVMERLERFLALLHHNSNFGHSGLFAMPLDGDGCDKVTVSPKPRFAHEVDLVGGIGGDVEIAQNGCYTVKKTESLKTNWIVKPAAALYKNDELHKAIPSTIYRD